MEEPGDRGRGPPHPGSRSWTGEATQKTPLILHSMCIDREAGRPRHESVVGSPLRRGVARGAQGGPMDRGGPPIGCRQEEEMHTIRPVGGHLGQAQGSTWPITCHDGRLWRAGMGGAAHLLREGAFKRCRVLPTLTPGKTERGQKAVETRLGGCRPRVRRHQGQETGA